MRAAFSCWLMKHNDWKKGLPEDIEFHNKMNQLYKDITKCLQQLPF